MYKVVSTQKSVYNSTIPDKETGGKIESMGHRFVRKGAMEEISNPSNASSNEQQMVQNRIKVDTPPR